MRPAGCPAAGRPWGDDNRIHASPEPQGPFPRRPRSSARGHPRQGRLRRRRRRPGSARSLTQLARSHEHGRLRREREATGPFPHALQTPPHLRNRRPKPRLTPARSFRDEWTLARRSQGFKVWPAVRCPGGRPNGADTKAPPLPRAPSCITERAAAHSLQFGPYALSAAGLLAALAVRPVPSCALIIPRTVND
jgi:hypothetical protein